MKVTIVNKLNNIVSGLFSSRFSATTAMPPLPSTKVSGKQRALPSFLATAKPSDSKLPNQDLDLANIDISALRSGRSTPEVLNKLAKSSPDLSAAVAAGTRMAVTTGKLIVTNPDGTPNADGILLGQQLMRRFNVSNPTGVGFNPYRSMRSVSESLSRELQLYGSCGLELVLDSARLPEGLQPVSITKLKFRAKKNRLIPVQVNGSEEIVLDIPTFFYVALDQDLTQAYSDSPVQASLQPLIASNDFMNDLRRVFRRAIHPRQKVVIDEQKWRSNVPADVLYDPDKLTEFMNTTISDIESKINGLSPEDAMVYFDTLDFAIVTNKDQALSEEYKTLASILDGKMASGTKTAGIVLNHASAASQNIASTSSMLFVKSVESAVQAKLNEIYSRMFTVAIRLFGLDVVAEFKYKEIDLRPDLELEAFKSMRQSRILEQLSIGAITDIEAVLDLTGSIPPPGYKSLSGTMFRTGVANPANPTSPTSALNQDLNSTAPKQPKTQKAS